VNFLSTYFDKKSCHTSTTLRISIVRFVSDSWASCLYGIATTDFEALYAYKYGEHQQCLRLSTHNVRTLIGIAVAPRVFVYPELFIMDDDIVTLIGFTLIVNPSLRDHLLNNSVDQLNLSLYRRLSVRWSYITQWRHWLRRSTT